MREFTRVRKYGSDFVRRLSRGGSVCAFPLFATGATLPTMGFSIGDVITALAADLGTALTAVILFGSAVLIIGIAWRWLKGSAKTR